MPLPITTIPSPNFTRGRARNVRLVVIHTVEAPERGTIAEDLKLAAQSTLDAYESGINVVRVNLDRADPPREVIDSFREVQAAQQGIYRREWYDALYRDEDGIARCDKRDAKGSYIPAPKKSSSTGARPNL